MSIHAIQESNLQMENNLKAEITQLHAQVCSGLSDPTRILILYKVAESPINVSDLAASLEVPQPTVSRHLKVLKDRRMVTGQREGKSVYYSLSDKRIIQALDLLRAVLANSLEEQVALARTATQTP
jgi:ArsR family transcriptional regulator